MAEPEEVEVRTLPESTRAVTALTRRQETALQSYGGSASFPLADLSDAEFSTLTNRMRTHISRLKQIQRDLMIPGVHYGVPGERDAEKIKKAADQGKVGIYKAGAEFLAKLHNHVARVEYALDYGDPRNETSPAITVRSTCNVHLGDLAGPLVAIGVGAATSWEVKYRYRNEQRKCPDCGVPALIFQKEAKGGEFRGQPSYWCAQFKGGCNRNFAEADPRIVGQEIGKVTNPDAFDLLNTLVKMSAKRARVDGEITASAASDLFTQDVEDLPPHEAERMRREVAVGAEETVSQMYDAPGDPDAWRQEVATAKPADVAASVGAPVAPKPAPDPAPATKLASEAQLKAIKTLLWVKCGVRGPEGQNAKLSELLGVTASLGSIAVSVASTVIGALNKMPDKPGQDPAPGAESSRSESLTASGGALADTAENRNHLAGRIRVLSDQIETATPGRKVLDMVDGIPMICGGNELAVMKFSKPYPLEYLDVDQLTKLGKYLRAELERKGVAA